MVPPIWYNPLFGGTVLSRSRLGPMEKTKTRVSNADNMDADTFTKHFNARHKADLGGANEITNTLTGELLEMHRSFHRRIHELAPWLDHEHSEGK